LVAGGIIDAADGIAARRIGYALLGATDHDENDGAVHHRTRDLAAAGVIATLVLSRWSSDALPEPDLL
jgi:hypothetical protein